MREASKERGRRTKIMQNLQIKVNWPFTKAGEGRSIDKQYPKPQTLKVQGRKVCFNFVIKCVVTRTMF